MRTTPQLAYGNGLYSRMKTGKIYRVFRKVFAEVNEGHRRISGFRAPSLCPRNNFLLRSFNPEGSSACARTVIDGRFMPGKKCEEYAGLPGPSPRWVVRSNRVSIQSVQFHEPNTTGYRSPSGKQEKWCDVSDEERRRKQL